LVACDPFAFLQPIGTPFIQAPSGTFRVIVTLADVSENQDRSHIREAYASIIFSGAPESYRKALPLARDGEDRPECQGDNYIGFGVDAGQLALLMNLPLPPVCPMLRPGTNSYSKTSGTIVGFVEWMILHTSAKGLPILRSRWQRTAKT
jgi:hypothetical protein